MKKEFLDLGKHPIANAFLKEKDFDDEFLFDLKVVFDTESKLVSIKNFVEPEKIFNENYPYTTSNSFPMVKHFKETAEMLMKEFNPLTVMEIGSNDGVFLKNWPTDYTIGVEPCGNFSLKTAHMGYQSYTSFWNTELSEKIKSHHGKMDLIYAANCICHIHDLDDTFKAVKNLLSKDGVFVFEDPSLLRILERNSYDQIYDEHPHIFSITALDNILIENGLKIFRVENLSVHGGSNRVYVSHLPVHTFLRFRPVEMSVRENLQREDDFGLNEFKTYQKFAKRVEESRNDLVELLVKLKNDGKRIMSIGATAKSTTVFNYCGIGAAPWQTDLIELITDTTKDKQEKYSPGSHIPVVDRELVNINDYDYAFLGAWNLKDYIIKNEKKFNGKFITHVPKVEVV